MTNHTLDFIIIGAQKSGTTSMFQYLRLHPEIFMPPAKELPFFIRSEAPQAELDGFFKRHFSKAPPGQICGKATPQYMCNPAVPEKMFSCLPDVKLIAILRNPILRAASHFKMCIRRKLDIRTFDQAITESLDPDALKRARSLRAGAENERYCYVAWSEYGRILQKYRKYFPAENLLVLFTEELADAPNTVLGSAFRFLGVSEDFQSPIFHKRYFQGGEQSRFPPIQAMRKSIVNRILPHILPSRLTARIRYAYEQLSVIPDSTSPELSEDIRSRLLATFRDDLTVLRELTGLSVPWAEFSHLDSEDRLV